MTHWPSYWRGFAVSSGACVLGIALYTIINLAWPHVSEATLKDMLLAQAQHIEMLTERVAIEGERP